MVSIINGNNKLTLDEPGCPAHVLVDHKGLGTPCLGAVPATGTAYPGPWPHCPRAPRLPCALPGAAASGRRFRSPNLPENLPAAAMLAAPSDSSTPDRCPRHDSARAAGTR